LLVRELDSGVLTGSIVVFTTARWLYCVEFQQYSIRLESLGYLCDCLGGHGRK